MTSMHIDSEKQAAIKIQAIGRGVSSRKVTFEALPSSEAAMAWLVAAVLLFAAAWAAAILASVPAVAPTPPPPALPNGPLMRVGREVSSGSSCGPPLVYGPPLAPSQPSPFLVCRCSTCTMWRPSSGGVWSTRSSASDSASAGCGAAFSAIAGRARGGRMREDRVTIVWSTEEAHHAMC